MDGGDWVDLQIMGEVNIDKSTQNILLALEISN